MDIFFYPNFTGDITCYNIKQLFCCIFLYNKMVITDRNIFNFVGIKIKFIH